MPAIVIGADTELGQELVDALVDPEREVRAFVTDPVIAVHLKDLGVKVATGDVSDPSHIAAACTNVFTAILVTEAATDERERSFASTVEEVLQGWADAVSEARVNRVIWVSDVDPPRSAIDEEVVVAHRDGDVVGAVVALDGAEMIEGRSAAVDR